MKQPGTDTGGVDPTTDRPQGSVFATTRWTLVIRSRDEDVEGRSALSELCAAYHAPVEAFIRRQTRNAGSVEDLTQEFFRRILAGSAIQGADPDRGRFRSYLLGAVKHFLHAEWERRGAQRRGGGVEHLPLAGAADETAVQLQIPDASAESPDILFDRRWAQAMLDRALIRLRSEFEEEDAAVRRNLGRVPGPPRLSKSTQFDVLKPSLLGSGSAVSQAELGRRLGLSETAVKVAIHRLRRRFRDAVKSEIRDTLAEPSQVDEELRHLLAALSS